MKEHTMNKFLITGATALTGAILVLTPTVAMAATPATAGATAAITTNVGSISKPTATLVNHAPYGKVYELRGTVNGTKAGDWVRVLTANNQPAAGFHPFQLGSAISTYTVYYNPGSMAGQYKVQIGNQISAGVQLNAIPAAATLPTRVSTGGR